MFRLGLGAAVLADTLIRVQDLTRHYTDEGVLPRAVLTALQPWTWTGWPHFWSGSAQAAEGWFVLTVAAGLALLIGWHSRAAAAAAWVLLRSVQARNPFVLYGVDALLCLLLFWALFLPLDARWSALRERGGRAPGAVASAGSFGLVLQISLVHVAAGLYKTAGTWVDGTAVWYALQSDLQSTAFGRLWLDHQGLLSAATHAVPWAELIGGALLLGSERARMVGIVVLAGLHLGIAACLDVGLFPWVNLTGLAALVPPRAWPGPAPDLRREPVRGIQRLAAGAAALAVVLTAGALARTRPPPPVRDLAYLVGMQQRWTMYRNPLKLEGWLVMPGRLSTGDTVDLTAGERPVSFEKPSDLRRRIRNHRELKLMQRLMVRKDERLFAAWAAVACRAWAAHHPDGPALETVEFVAMVERAPAPGQPAPALETHALGAVSCAADPRQ